MKRPLLNGLMTVQKKWNRNALFDAVWNGDSERITKEMNSLLRRTISYYDYKEDFYHAFLAGIFTGAGYMVDSNKAVSYTHLTLPTIRLV